MACFLYLIQNTEPCIFLPYTTLTYTQNSKVSGHFCTPRHWSLPVYRHGACLYTDMEPVCIQTWSLSVYRHGSMPVCVQTLESVCVQTLQPACIQTLQPACIQTLESVYIQTLQSDWVQTWSLSVYRLCSLPVYRHSSLPVYRQCVFSMAMSPM